MYLKAATILILVLNLTTGCEVTNIKTVSSILGTPTSTDEMLKNIETPGPIVFQKHLAATWRVPLSGLLNLEHPKAQAAMLEDKDEDIEIYVYSLVHPTAGTYIIDSGVANSFKDPDDNPDISTIVKLAMNTDALKLRKSTRSLLAELGNITGVLLTHTHLDHIMGLTDLSPETNVYIGPSETRLTSIENLFTQGTTDRLLAVQSKLQEWQFDSTGVIDVFGDGSLFAIHAPGHSPGSTAYLARTTNGPELMLGDVTHTRWGWNNGVEPGTFSNNQVLSAISLEKIQSIASKITEQGLQLGIHPGHQSLK